MSCERIEFDEFPARLWMLAEKMEAMGAELDYFGGFGPLGKLGRMLRQQIAPMCREIADELEAMLDAREGEA